ncbi:MAG: hypothetical protein HYV29_15885 [Ignavibacteriales bacterium]|nr:hypothetical protein [Ignavibacteriales bacterium]
MKKSLFTLICLVSLASIAMFNGCKDETTAPAEDKTVPNDVFPLTAGHKFTYNGYLTVQDTETPVSGSSAVYASSWSVGSAATPLSAIFGAQYGAYVSSKNGGRTSASLIYDSTTVAPGVTVFTPIFVYYDSTSHDYYYMTNLGQFFRSSVVKDSAGAAGVRMDSLRFIKLASPSAGIGGTFTCFEQTYASYANPGAVTNITLKITGKWEGKQDVTVNGQTFSAYYIKIDRAAVVNGVTASSGVTAKVWLVKGVGPVKMFLAGNTESPGNFRELTVKNF